MKNLQRTLALFLAAMLLVTLTACDGGGADSSLPAESLSSTSGGLPPDPDAPEPIPVEQPFTLGFYTDVSFNPYFCENTLNQNIISLLFDPLVDLDEQFAVQPCLATKITVSTGTDNGGSDEEETPDTSQAEPESSEDEDGNEDTSSDNDADSNSSKKKNTTVTTVTVELRTDVKFKDGTKMTASDVVYSLTQAKREDSIYYERLKKIKSVKAEDTETVVIKVEGAAANFDRLLDIPIVEEGTGQKDLPTGTGAYKLRYDGNGIPSYLEQNTGWWKEETLPLEEIPLYAAKDSDYLLYGFGSGEVSLVATDLTGSNSLGYSGNFQVADYPTTVMLYLGCNTAKGACSSKNVRSAIYYALDRETLSTKLLSGHAQPSSLPISPSAADYQEEVASELGQNLERAEERLSGSYYGAKVKLIVNADSDFKVSLAKEIKAELEAIGMDVSVSELSWSDFKSAIDSGSYDLYLGEVKMTADFSLDAFLTKDGALNDRGYSSKDVTALYETFCQTRGEQHLTAAKKLYQELAKEAPFIPLCFKSYSALYQWKTLTSLTPTQQNLFYHFSSWSFASDETGEEQAAGEE